MGSGEAWPGSCELVTLNYESLDKLDKSQRRTSLGLQRLSPLLPLHPRMEAVLKPRLLLAATASEQVCLGSRRQAVASRRSPEDFYLKLFLPPSVAGSRHLRRRRRSPNVEVGRPHLFLPPPAPAPPPPPRSLSLISCCCSHSRSVRFSTRRAVQSLAASRIVCSSTATAAEGDASVTAAADPAEPVAAEAAEGK